jgi:hypothetical protein
VSNLNSIKPISSKGKNTVNKAMYSTTNSGVKRTPVAKMFKTLTTSSKMPKNLKIGLEPDSEVQIDVVRKQIYPAKSSQLEYFDADP